MKISLLFTLVVGLLAAFTGAAEDWPQFLGPRANNTSTETNLLDRWPTNGPPLLWEQKIGTGYSAPSVRSRQLVLHHRRGNEEIVESFETGTGAPGWSYRYPCEYIDPYGYNNGPRCTPLLTSNRCYTFGVEGQLLCLDLATGRVIWQRDTAKEWNVPPAFFGVGATPILEGGILIVMAGGQPNAAMVGLDAQTGKTLWESVGEKTWQGQITIGWPQERAYIWRGGEKLASYATPTAATVNGRRHIFCTVRQGLVSLNPTNGEVNFSRWFQSYANDSVNAMNPVVVGDMVFISAAYYRVGSVLLQVKPDGRSFEELWRSPKQLRELDPNTGRPTQPVLEIHWNTPVYHAGYLYALGGRNEPDARFRCIELRTGKLMWDRDESWAPHSTPQPAVYGRGSAILADGRLIVLGEGGLLGLFKVNPQREEELSRWQVPALHYPCWAAPVLASQRLYLRSEDRLVCFDIARR